MAVIHDGYLLDLFRAKIRIFYLPIHLNSLLFGKKFSLPGITHLFFVGTKMWRQVKATSQDESIGRRRNINPVHVAFIVDKYLCDNHFSNTRCIFRNEASSLFATSSINQVSWPPFCVFGNLLFFFLIVCCCYQRIRVHHTQTQEFNVGI